jgi:hypothetical protein
MHATSNFTANKHCLMPIDAPPAATLLNPDFEWGSNAVSSGSTTINGVTATSWWDNSDNSAIVTYTLNTTISHSGSRSQCIAFDAASPPFSVARLVQHLHVEAGTHKGFALTLWAKVISSNPGPVAVALTLQSSSSTTIHNSLQQVSHGWVQLDMASVPMMLSGTTVSATFQFSISTPGATVCVDNAALTASKGKQQQVSKNFVSFRRFTGRDSFLMMMMMMMMMIALVNFVSCIYVYVLLNNNKIRIITKNTTLLAR